MKYLCISLIPFFLVAASPPALADDVADERARLANQCIQIEEQRRAREEAERLSQAAREQASPEQSAREPAISNDEPEDSASEAVVSDASVERMEMSRALEQLRELGALRDAGYVTEQEFEQLKKKILDAAL